MKKFFNKYSEAILAVLAVVFISLLISVFSWGIGDIITAVDNSVNSTGNSPQTPGFDLQGAQALDLRGLVK